MENEGQTTSIDSITLSKQVPYSDLDILFDYHSITENNEGGLYILCNLSPIIRALLSDYHKDSINGEMIKEHPLRLTYNLLRLVWHFRFYIHTRYYWKTNFYFYYSTTECIHKTFILSGYRKKFYGKIKQDTGMVEYINRNLSFTRKYLDAIPSVYLVDTGQFDSEAFPEVIRRKGGSDIRIPLIVLSGSINDFQIVEHQIDDPKDNGKVFVFVHPINSSKFSFVSQNNFKQVLEIPGGTCFYLSLLGDKSLNVPGKSLYGEKKSAKWLTRNAGKLNFKNQKLEDLVEILGHSVDDYEMENVKKSWQCLNHRDYVNKYFTENEFIKMRRQLNDTYHHDDLEQINKEYFPLYPVDLDRLMAGETQ